MKVLLMSFECSPYRGSEWAVGWGRLLQASRVAETHIITSESNFAALQKARGEGLVPENVFVYTPAPDAKLRSMEAKPGLFAYNYAAYNHWQKLAFTLARELNARESFDLVHQVNVCTFREPGYTWQLDVPYLWGPVGGSQNFPAAFLPMLPPVEAFKEAMRGLSNQVSLRYKSRVQQAAKHATRVIAANSTNRTDYQQAFHRDIDLLLETGLHQVEEPNRERYHARVEAQQQGAPAPSLRILWSGEFQTRKALPILLRALASLKGQIPYTLRILGAGPMEARWKAEAEHLRLNSSTTTVEFLGRLPFPDAVAEMTSAELFCFTSLRDTSGNVALEALAAGVPVICFDHQGAGDMVSNESGVKLKVTSPKRAIADWAEAIRTLAEDPQRLLRLSEGTTAQARTFLWSANGDRVNAIYRELAAKP